MVVLGLPPFAAGPFEQDEDGAADRRSCDPKNGRLILRFPMFGGLPHPESIETTTPSPLSIREGRADVAMHLEFADPFSKRQQSAITTDGFTSTRPHV
jgi:hypothetical protein